MKWRTYAEWAEHKKSVQERREAIHAEHERAQAEAQAFDNARRMVRDHERYWKSGTANKPVLQPELFASDSMFRPRRRTSDDYELHLE